MIPSLSPAELKSWRETHRLSQDELGDALGISREWVGKLERGEREISAKILLRFEALKREPRFALNQPAGENLDPGVLDGRVEDPFCDMPKPVAFARGDGPVDHEYAALLQKLEHALESIEARGAILDTEGSRDACSAARAVFARYMDAGKNRDRIGWLNIEIRRLLDSAPFPKKHP